MTITLRSEKGSALTHNELDGNFTDLDARAFTLAEIAAGLLIHGNETYSDSAGSQALGTAVWTKLTNNAAGPLTDDTFKLPGSTGMWDEVAGEINFTDGGLVLGDKILLRVDLTLTTTSPNTAVGLRATFGVGDANEYSIEFESSEIRTARTEPVVRELTMTMDNTLTLDNPAIFEMLSEKSGDSVVVNGWKFIGTPRTPALKP